MKVLEVVKLNPNKFGSFEKYCLGHGVYLRNRGHQHVACYKDDVCQVLQEEADKVGGKFIKNNYKNLGLFNAISLLLYIKKNNVDVVHLHFYPIYSVFSFLARFSRCKTFYSYRISGDFSNNHFLVNILKKIRSKVLGIGIDGVFCVSDFAREKFLNNYQANPENVVTVHNGLNWSYFPDDSIARRESRSDFRIICVAALIAEKGVVDVIDAFLQIKKEVENIKLTIVGDGDNRIKLETKVKAAGCDHQIQFLGSRDDVPALLSNADVAVVPSRWGEAFGFTVIEAMAAGLPVIASSVGGIPEIIQHERTGILVEKGNSAQIAAALLYLYNNPDLRIAIGREAKARVQDYFNVNRVYQQQLEYYNASAFVQQRSSRKSLVLKYGSRRGFLSTVYHQFLYSFGRYHGYKNVDWSKVDRLVFICKGNICRSVYAEKFAHSLGLDAISCGIDTIEDAPANANAMTVAEIKGINLKAHKTKPVMYVDLKYTDLLIAMEPWQVKFLQKNLNRCHQFSLLGLWGRPALPHLQDPYGTSEAYFSQCFSVIETSVRGIGREMKQRIKTFQ